MTTEVEEINKDLSTKVKLKYKRHLILYQRWSKETEKSTEMIILEKPLDIAIYPGLYHVGFEVYVLSRILIFNYQKTHYNIVSKSFVPSITGGIGTILCNVSHFRRFLWRVLM